MSKQLDALHEEGALLRVEEGETVVDRDLRDIGLDLREVGVEGGVDRVPGRGLPLHVDADVSCPVGVPERLARRLGCRHVLARRVGGEDEAAGAGQPEEADQGLRVADEAVGAARDGPAVDRVAVVARVVAPDEDAPLLRVALRVAQRREGDPHLRRPAEIGDARRGVVEDVGREVLVLRGVVEDGVALLAARAHAELEGGEALAAGVEQDGHVVVGAHDLVALHEGRADTRGVRVLAAQADVEVPVVVGDPGGRLRLRGHVVAGSRLPELVEDGGPLPAGVGEDPVQADLAVHAADGQGGGSLGGARHRAGEQGEEGRRGQAHPGHSKD